MDKKKRNKLVLSIKRCIYEKFSFSDWTELGYITDGKDVIDLHPRLLRSLSFGDDDYHENIFDVIETLIKQNPSNLQTIIDYIELPTWMEKNLPQDYKEIYGFTHTLLQGAEEMAITNSFELNIYITRIRKSIESDPELAIGSTKEMLESVFKLILEAHGETIDNDDLPQLLKRTQKLLKLDPNDIDGSTKGSDIVKRTLSNLGQVVNGINQLRNLYGSGHGRSRNSGISSRHARLVVGTGSALATFLMETFEYHQNKNT